MMGRLAATMLIVFCLAPPASAHMAPVAEQSAPAQVPAAPPKPVLRVEQLGEGAYCLYGQGGNIGIVVTPAALFVVDTQFEALAPAIHEEIRNLSPAAIKYVVDTHYHFDHVGGNRYFAKIADIVGHENVRERLYAGPPDAMATLPPKLKELESILALGKPMEAAYRTLLEAKVRVYKTFLGMAKEFKPEEVVAPAITYDGALKLYVGDEEVQIFHAAAGHTDGDSMVYFPKRKILHMGDLFVNATFPFIDVEGGGSSEGWLKNLDAALAKVPADTRIIPGHGEAAGVPELRRFRGYISDLRAAVSGAVKAGKSLEEAVRDIKLDAYADIKPSFMSLPQNIDQAWDELGGKR